MALELPDGARCFVDSTIFYYALVPTASVSEHCLGFFDRAIASRLTLLAGMAVLSDAVHKVMISEVAQLTGRDRAGMIGYLNQHPEIIARLTEYPQAMERLSVVPMEILPIDAPLLREATHIAVENRLLTNDAVIVALLQRHGLTDLVTNDDDFDGLPGIRIWKPR